MDARAIERLLYFECGLKGLSGESADVRDLLASDSPRARLALDYLAYRAAREVAGLAAAMGGIDGLVFTAGVGENAPEVRARICERCAWLGVRLDEERNRAHGPEITAEASPVPGYVVPTDEELMIARHTLAALRRN
jgi:acetate kinase